MNMNTDRQLGRFTIPTKWVRSRDHKVTRIMGCCAILRAECLAYRDVIEYHASCMWFDEVEEGVIIPTYDWIFHEDGSLACERKD